MSVCSTHVLPILVGFCAGVLFSYSSFLMRSVVLIWRGNAWPTDSFQNETVYVDVEVKVSGPILRRTTTNINQLSFNDSWFRANDTAVADRLFKQIKILCLVLTHPENHQKKAIHVNATWGKRCNKLLFVTSKREENLPTLVLNVADGHRYLGYKTRKAFGHAYTHYLDDFDWFMKGDDDTYVIMENLRYFLSMHDHNSPVYFGEKFSLFVKQRYTMVGLDSGYVASREALKRFGRRKKQTQGCVFNSGYEDVDFGKCMESLGVKFGDSLDALGKTLFHCFNATVEVRADRFPDWFDSYDPYNGAKKGMAALSDFAISFHYVDPDGMYLMEYFVYHLNPFGINKGLQNLNSNGTTV